MKRNFYELYYRLVVEQAQKDCIQHNSYDD